MGEPAIAHLNGMERDIQSFGERKNLTVVPAVRTQEHPNVRTHGRWHSGSLQGLSRLVHNEEQVAATDW
jgi:hypothetical protein